MNDPLRIERNGDQGPTYFWIIASGYWGYWPLAPATAPANVPRLLATEEQQQVDAPRSRTVRPIRVLSKVQSVDPRMRLECSAGFRQLRTCRRTRPGQLCAHKRKFIKVRSTCSARDRQMLARHGVSAQFARHWLAKGMIRLASRGRVDEPHAHEQSAAAPELPGGLPAARLGPQLIVRQRPQLGVQRMT